MRKERNFIEKCPLCGRYMSVTEHHHILSEASKRTIEICRSCHDLICRTAKACDTNFMAKVLTQLFKLPYELKIFMFGIFASYGNNYAKSNKKV